MLDDVAPLLGLLVVLPGEPIVDAFVDPLAAPLPLAIVLLVLVDVLDGVLVVMLVGVAVWGMAID